MQEYRTNEDILKGELKTPLKQIQFVTFFVTLLLMYIAFKLHMMIWNRYDVDFLMFSISIVPVIIVMGIIHEMIHYFVLKGRVPKEALEIHFSWKTITPFVYYKRSLRPNLYRLFVIAPVIVLGLFPATVGLATGHEYITLYGAIGIAIGTGDMIEIIRTINVPSDQMID